MNIKLKSLEILNFKGIKHRTVDFGDTTRISGANATGKSSMFDAFTWLLFDKDSLGNSKFNIRPLDANGDKIHNVEIEVVATLNVDGKEVVLHKVQREKWVKKRGSGVAELQGNENLFEIDAYPKTEKEYKAFIAELLSEDLFKVLTNPQHFPNLPWKEQRAMLMKFAEDMPDAQLAVELGGFEDLVIELEKAPSTDDIQKKYAKALSEWKKKQAEIPVRIDELERSKTDIDVASIEKEKKMYNLRLAECEKKREALDEQIKTTKEKSDGIMKLKFKLSDLQLAANVDLDKKRQATSAEWSRVAKEASDVEIKIISKKKAVGFDERDRKLLLEQIQKKGSEFKDAQALVFDESAAVCTYCGQEYTAEKKEAMRASFEAAKQAHLKEISERGNELTAEYKILGEQIKVHKKEVSTLEADLKELFEEAETLKEMLHGMPDRVDISDREDVVALKKQIADMEQAMLDEQLKLKEREDLVYEIEQMRKSVWMLDVQLAKVESNQEIEERIEELQAEQRAVAQKVANQERMIYLLEEFIRAKMERIAGLVNSKFGQVSFKLFETQINGGVKECCECMVGGVPYGSLNSGHRIVAGLEIIRALQTLYDAYLPIWVDNAESINEFNIPQMDNQMILLAVSENKELKVEV